MARKLDRLNAANSKGVAFTRLWQRNCEAVEADIADLSDVTDALAAQLALIVAAQADADAAQATANTANSTATTVKRDDKISASWISPGNVLSAADVGSDCTVTIAAHARKYGDGSSLSVGADTITGLAFSTTYYVYYTDTTLVDTTPTYLATTNPNTAQPNAAAGRHFVGLITTPADGGGGSTGGYTPPGGYNGPNDIP